MTSKNNHSYLKPKFNTTLEIQRICRFIRDYVTRAGAKGVVIGVSGGIDSAVVASLSARALGRGKVTGLLMFEDHGQDSRDHDDAKRLISSIGISSYEISFSPIVESFRRTLQNFKISRTALGNIKARTRMIILYGLANSRNLLVAGTGDKSEESIGYFTKYGDGGVDFQPIAHLYKSEVKLLAMHLGVPEQIVNKPSSPHLWKGHLATDEIPADYPVLDRVLSLLYDKGKKPDEVSKELKISRRVVSKVADLHTRSIHKRMLPPSVEDTFLRIA